MLMQNGMIPDTSSFLNGANICERFSYVYLGGRGVNKINDLAQALRRREQVAWGAFKNIEGSVKKPNNIRLIAVLPALTSAIARLSSSQYHGLYKSRKIMHSASFNVLWKTRCLEVPIHASADGSSEF
ncbi:hypothetical protein V3C99_018487 [Haemonchus contortus]|uniref:Transposase n=1 Tax=Haemonchus contortus TaxID=6289 RepID=A0A7I4Z240_HAECO